MNEPLTLLWILLGACAVVLSVALLMVRRTRRELARTRQEARELRSRVDDLAEQVGHREPAPAPEPSNVGYLITAVGAEPEPEFVPARIEGRLFADIVLRESVVCAAALTHGVRRALDPQTRNRIRFEMRREVKRSRKQRRADLKAARREWEARQRARLDEDAA